MKINRNRFSRREFIGIGAAAAGASLGLKTILLDPDPLWALPQAVAPSDRVRFGMIGIGMQGSGLLANAIELPGVECAAACDLYDGRHTLAKEIVRPNLPTTRRYRELQSFARWMQRRVVPVFGAANARALAMGEP